VGTYDNKFGASVRMPSPKDYLHDSLDFQVLKILGKIGDPDFDGRLPDFPITQ
jgi:hypothetical protein